MKVKLNSGVEYWVSFYHENYTNHDDITQSTLSSYTKCKIENKTNPEFIQDGIAVLRKGDRFYKDYGRKLAMKRAMNNLGLNKETRKLFWNTYFEYTNKKQRIK